MERCTPSQYFKQKQIASTKQVREIHKKVQVINYQSESGISKNQPMTAARSHRQPVTMEMPYERVEEEKRHHYRICFPSQHEKRRGVRAPKKRPRQPDKQGTTQIGDDSTQPLRIPGHQMVEFF